MKTKKILNPLTIIAITISIFVFLKNAWIAEDAYIIFRSLDQLYAGNGPTWNPHERVQVYTSPMWYITLACVRLFSDNYYLTTILLSLILLIATLIIIRMVFQDSLSFLFTSLILIGSNGFFDYTSSGLENMLGYFLISCFLMFYLRLFSRSNEVSVDQKDTNLIFLLMVLFGLLIFVRHDLVTLLLPAVVFIVFSRWTVLSVRKWALVAAFSFTPLLIFTLFSTLYYGFPLPNTAYAKLFTGIDKIELIKQGLKYITVSLRYDSLTSIVILSTIILFLFLRDKKHLRFLMIGVLLNLVYIISVGGDFMQGRFLSFSFLTSLLVIFPWLFSVEYRGRIKWFAFAIIGLYLAFFPHTPLNSPLDYENQAITMGIADERGFYFKGVSLYSYLTWNPETQLFPRNALSIEGREFKKSTQEVIVTARIGIFGYFAGTEKIIVDPLALSDPFLARLPAEEKWRIGHFNREIPQGYIESVLSGENLILDPNLHQYYEELKIVTQSDDLLSIYRLKKIIQFNLGYFDYLLPGN